jgi:hypothetical protein
MQAQIHGSTYVLGCFLINNDLKGKMGAIKIGTKWPCKRE